jgi:hypothetical protein
LLKIANKLNCSKIGTYGGVKIKEQIWYRRIYKISAIFENIDFHGDMDIFLQNR